MTRRSSVKPIGIYVRLSEVRPGQEAVSLDTQEQDKLGAGSEAERV
jgi:hypothetical protein